MRWEWTKTTKPWLQNLNNELKLAELGDNSLLQATPVILQIHFYSHIRMWISAGLNCVHIYKSVQISHTSHIFLFGTFTRCEFKMAEETTRSAINHILQSWSTVPISGLYYNFSHLKCSFERFEKVCFKLMCTFGRTVRSKSILLPVSASLSSSFIWLWDKYSTVSHNSVKPSDKSTASNGRNLKDECKNKA